MIIHLLRLWAAREKNKKKTDAPVGICLACIHFKDRSGIKGCEVVLVLLWWDKKADRSTTRSIMMAADEQFIQTKGFWMQRASWTSRCLLQVYAVATIWSNILPSSLWTLFICHRAFMLKNTFFFLFFFLFAEKSKYCISRDRESRANDLFQQGVDSKTYVLRLLNLQQPVWRITKTSG